jgi:hypothetical protein
MKKLSFLLVASALVLFSCDSASEAPETVVEETVEVVEETVEVVEEVSTEVVDSAAVMVEGTEEEMAK